MKIPLYEPKMTFCDALAVGRQVFSGWVGPGDAVDEFEDLVAQEIGVEHCVATTSGTMALLLAIKALKIPQGSTIFVPAYGFVAAAEVSRFLGYRVQLVDIEQGSLQMDPNRLWEELKLHRALFPAFGSSAGAVIAIEHNGPRLDGDLVPGVCKHFSVPLIADGACSLGCIKLYPRPRLTTLSFSVPKLVTCGQGGAVCTNDGRLAKELRDWTDHGGLWREDRLYRQVGLNARMTDVQAALGMSQMRRIGKLIKRRAEIRSWYLDHIPLVPRSYDGWFCIYHTKQAEDLVEWLQLAGVGAARLYRPIVHSPAYAALADKAYLVAEQAYKELVYLPSGLTLKRSQVEYICEQIKQFEQSELLSIVSAA